MEPPEILIVDDDRDIRTLLADYLGQNGFRARRALERSAADFVVLD